MRPAAAEPVPAVAARTGVPLVASFEAAEARLAPLVPADDLSGSAVADAPSWPPATRMLSVGGARVRVAVHGEGPPLLLLNGIGGNIEMWDPVARRLSGRRLILLDMPGTGESPPLPVPLRLAGYARLVVRVLDQLGVERTDVMGYSWGGALAQQLAHDAPERVRSLVLAATMCGLGGQPPAPWVVGLMATPARYYSRTYLRVVAPVVFGSDPHQAADSESGNARLRRPPSMVGYSQQLYAISGWSSRPWLRRLQVPTLVLAGARDPLVPHRNCLILSRCIAGAQLRVVEGGHLFLIERPDEGCQAVSEFLGRQDTRAAEERQALAASAAAGGGAEVVPAHTVRAHRLARVRQLRGSRSRT